VCCADLIRQGFLTFDVGVSHARFLFESAETGECMQLVGVCEPNGLKYDIEMGPCDPSNGKAFWAFTGIGEIVHFECMVCFVNFAAVL
jgi:hypothetical protein